MVLVWFALRSAMQISRCLVSSRHVRSRWRDSCFEYFQFLLFLILGFVSSALRHVASSLLRAWCKCAVYKNISVFHLFISSWISVLNDACLDRVPQDFPHLVSMCPARWVTEQLQPLTSLQNLTTSDQILFQPPHLLLCFVFFQNLPSSLSYSNVIQVNEKISKQRERNSKMFPASFTSVKAAATVCCAVAPPCGQKGDTHTHTQKRTCYCSSSAVEQVLCSYCGSDFTV